MDIDTQISQLSRIPSPDLSRLDGSRLAARAAAERRESRMTIGLALVAALAIGVGGGALPSRSAQASPVLLGPSPERMPLVQMAKE